MLQPRWLILVACSFLLAGCPSLGPQAPPPSVDRAEAAARRGDSLGAARIFEQLADENAGADRNEFLLRAARAFIAGRRPDEATRVLASLGPQQTPEQTLERSLLGVELSLANGEAQQAWQQINAIAQPAAAPGAIRYLALRQTVAFASGRPVDAVRAGIARERFLTTPETRRASRIELLGDLRDASERGLRIEPRASTDPVVRGWLELAPLAAAAARSPNAATADIEAWRTRYPTHPANDVVRSELLGIRTGGGGETVAHAALLLPLSGRQAAAGSIVRDGFMTAYFMDAASSRPRVRLYDTGEMSASEAITRATEAGAQLIVGPLTREEVMAAADFAIQRPPILALNFLPSDRPVPQQFFQFALSPEDEAREVARRILADGNRRGVVIAPDGDWGSRVVSAFTSEFEAGGGAVLSRVTFDPSETDYSVPITQVLRLTDSRARHQRLESIVGGKLAFEPRRRGDIGFIFAPGPAPIARLMRPQLRFHFAGDIPTYATSDAYDPDLAANRDMEGLYFPDMPWMLGGALAENVRAATRAAWPSGGPRRNRLFAFGFDSYRLMTTLRTQQGGAAGIVQGLTGRLAFGPDGRVRRDLDWAQMHDGQAQPLSPPTD